MAPQRSSMASPRDTAATRRQFLTGTALRQTVEQSLDQTGAQLADTLAEAIRFRAVPEAGPTVRIETQAMACTFSVVMNPGPPRQVMTASDALEMVHALEAQMTVYRPDSEMSRLNQRAATEPVQVELSLFELLLLARKISQE